MKQIVAFILAMGTLVPLGYCKMPENIDIVIECIDAYYSVAFGTPRYFETPITQVYFGFSGARDSFVSRQIVLTLRFHQETVEGEYTSVDNRKNTIQVTGRVDTDGDLVLQEVLDEEHFRYTFKGKLTKQEIKGMWGLGTDLLESFELFATTDEHSPWLQPIESPDKQTLLSATDRHGNTNLHIDARHRQTISVKYLLNLGANVNARNQEGRTPLHKSVDWEGRTLREKDISAILDVVGLLLSHGAEVNARDNHGVTPLSVAQKSGLKEVVELLREHGAKE